MAHGILQDMCACFQSRLNVMAHIVIWLQVRAMCWASNDSRVVSAGADGAVYEWRLSDLRREKENVLKGCQYK